MGGLNFNREPRETRKLRHVRSLFFSHCAAIWSVFWLRCLHRQWFASNAMAGLLDSDFSKGFKAPSFTLSRKRLPSCRKPDWVWQIFREELLLRRRRLRARKSEPRGTLVIASSSGLSHWSLTETLAVGTGPGNYTCPSGQRRNSASAAKSLDVFYRNLRNRRKTASFSHGGQLFFSFEESAYA